MPKRTRKPQQWLQIRMTKADNELLADLTRLYGLDKTKIVRYALKHMRDEMPVFTIKPNHADGQE